MNNFKGSMTIVLKGARIIDGTGSDPVTDGTLMIRDGYIMELGSGDQIEVPSDAVTYDLKGLTVLPGLIDTHTHIQLFEGDGELDHLKDPVPRKTLKAAYNAQKTLEAGFTTIRDLGAENLIDLAVRDACEEGIIKGPRMKVSGYKITPTGADFPIYPPELQISGRPVMDSPGEIRKATRTLLALGVDIIKIMTSGRTFRKSSSPNAYALSLEEAKTAVEEAHNQGVPVSSHAHGASGVKIALAAGCDTIEHGTVLDDEDIEFMLENKVFLIPTLSYGKRVEELGIDSGLPSYSVSKAISSRKQRLKSFKKALDAGVKIAMGSDAGMPFAGHGRNAFELEVMVEAGMTDMQAVMATTSLAAEALNIEEETGSIHKGKFADLVIVDGDPLQDIRLLQKKDSIVAVFKQGEIVSYGELEKYRS